MAWFSLRVREVPGSTPGQALSLLFHQKCFTSRNSIDLFWFSLIYWLIGCKELNDQAKEERQTQEAKKILYSHPIDWACIELWNSSINLFTIYEVFFERVLMECHTCLMIFIFMPELPSRAAVGCPISGSIKKAAHDYSTGHCLHILLPEQKLEN